MENSTETKKDVQAIATEKVLSYLEKSVVPWFTSWTGAGIPQNLPTRKEYRALNVFLLASLGYPKNFFITPKQLEELNGTLKSGESGHPIFYWKWNDEKEENTNYLEKNKPVLRYYYAYNIAQCNGIKKSQIPKIEKPKNPLEMCVALAENMPKRSEISHGIHPATYLPLLDCIDIPKKEDFPTDENYYSTFFRMLIHSTGHENRLNRKEVMEATVTDHEFYTKEALIGDIGASHLASLAGIRYDIGRDLSGYCTGWIENLKENTHLIVYASTQAQRAVDFILNRKKETMD